MEDKTESSFTKPSSWEKNVPWFLTIACTLTLIVIGYFLVSNIEWFKANVFNEQVDERNSPSYRFYAYHMHLSMIKRSVGLFSGFSIMFLGMGVAFYTMKEKFSGELKTTSISANIATSSPGIIAILVGGYLIVSTIQSKDEFPKYGEDQGELYAPPLPKDSANDSVNLCKSIPSSDTSNSIK